VVLFGIGSGPARNRPRRVDPIQTGMDHFLLLFAYTVIMSRYTKAHQVYMRFERQQYWHVSFMEPGLERELPRKLTFASPGRIL
jgi:hypothetical protein